MHATRSERSDVQRYLMCLWIAVLTRNQVSANESRAEWQPVHPRAKPDY